MSDSATSLSLVERVQRLEPESWRRLVDLYGPIVYRWCRRWNVPAGDAEDLVQEVFRRVAGGVGKFEHAGDGSFRGWLWTIARNVANDYFTRRRDAPLAAGGSTQQLVIQQIPDRDAASAADLSDERSRILHAALATIQGDFQEQTWQIFWRSAIDGHDTATIAADLGLTHRAIRQAKHRVMQRLREQFQGIVE